MTSRTPNEPPATGAVEGLAEIDLKEMVVALAEAGDKLAERLEGYEDDPVIAAYLKERHLTNLPLWARTDGEYTSGPDRAAWDELIGDCQRAGLVGPFDGDADVYEPVETR